jgi:hypothetical protein
MHLLTEKEVQETEIQSDSDALAVASYCDINQNRIKRVSYDLQE